MIVFLAQFIGSQVKFTVSRILTHMVLAYTYRLLFLLFLFPSKDLMFISMQITFLHVGSKSMNDYQPN